jgi:hypothetical protein
LNTRLSALPNMITRRSLAIASVVVGLIGVAHSALAQGQRHIQLAQLETMFANMRANTKWNVDGPLLWGYFFFDPNPEKLKLAASDLQAQGYRVVGIASVAGKDTFRLHVERVEAHTPASLNDRNNELYALATKYGLASYDGMDVGPVQAPPK